MLAILFPTHAGVECRQEAERDIGRHVVFRIRMRDVIGQCAERRRPRRRRPAVRRGPGWRRSGRPSTRTPRTRRSLPHLTSARRRTGRRVRASATFRAGRSGNSRRYCDESCRSRTNSACSSPGISAQHPRLVAPLHLRLKTDEAEVVTREVVLAELHDGVRLAPGSRIGQADGLHRSEPQACRRRVPAITSIGRQPSKNFG